MPTYTPSLVVSSGVKLRKERRLPLSGNLLVGSGQRVKAEDVVARADRPGRLFILHATTRLGMDPSDLAKALRVSVGQTIREGDLLAEVRGFMGLFVAQCHAPVSGTIEYATESTGHIGIRQPPIPIEIKAFVDGQITELLGQEGVVVESVGTLIQGIYGIGRERRGRVCRADRTEVWQSHQGPWVLVYPAGLQDKDVEMVRSSDQVVGVVTGGMTGDRLRSLGGERREPDRKEGLAVILTEGFGTLRMMDKTQRLLETMEGQMASMDGTTQIRAGVIRPDIFVSEPGRAGQEAHGGSLELLLDATVRILTPPHFGEVGVVVEMPEVPEKIETESVVRVARIQLNTGQVVTVPRSNLEVLGG